MSPARRGLPPSARRSASRYACSCGLLTGLFRLALLRAQRGHAHVRGAEHQADAHADKIDPFLFLDRQALGERPHLEEPDEIERGDDDEQPASARLAVVEDAFLNLPPR